MLRLSTETVKLAYPEAFEDLSATFDMSAGHVMFWSHKLELHALVRSTTAYKCIHLAHHGVEWSFVKITP